MLSTQYVFLFSSSIAPDDHGPHSLNSGPPISWLHQLHALSVAIKSFTLVLMLNFGLSNCQDIFGLRFCFDDGPHLVGLLVNLLNHLDQSVTGGHDWETFLPTVRLCGGLHGHRDVTFLEQHFHATEPFCAVSHNSYEYFQSVGVMILELMYKPSGVPFNLTPACCR